MPADDLDQVLERLSRRIAELESRLGETDRREYTTGGGGGTDANAVHVNAAGEIAGVALKATPTANDLTLIEDSAAGNTKKRSTLTSILSAVGAALFAPLNKGVTNGDNHDHSGGDGGPINNVGNWVAAVNTLHDQHSNIVLDGDDGRVSAHKLELPESATPAYPAAGRVRVFVNASGQLCTVDDANNVVVYMPATHDHVGGDGNLVNHATGLTGHNSTNYTHLTAANHTALTGGGETALHKHVGQLVPLTNVTLVDSAGASWAPAAKNLGTYTFRPQDQSAGSQWPTTATAVLIMIGGAWVTPSNASALTVRPTGSGANQGQVKALVSSISYTMQVISLLDANGYFVLLVEGANATTAVVRILGYYV